MKTTKRSLLLVVCIAVSIVANAQSEQWKAYQDICKQFRTDMTPCEKMELYARMDSLFDGQMPDYNNLYNYMISSFLCGDTMTFKKQLVRATDWKCWNSKLIDTWDAVDFLKKEKDWNQLDSLSKIYGTKKIYPYMDSLDAMVERDQTIRSELHNPNLSIKQKDSILIQWQIIDSTNLTLLKSLINKYGFPTWERVGYTGCRNAWLIAQHAIPYIYDFEKEYRKAVMDNNATKNLLAYLEDRSRTMRGLPQLYGTQLATNPKDYLPISDIKNVNSRREEIGLEPLNDYLKRMSIDINDYFILQDTLEPNYIDFYYKGNKLEPWGVIKAQGYLDENEYDKASVLYCHVFHNTYPFVRDLKRFVSTLIINGGKSDQYLFISTYEVLERMVLCGYEPDAWLDSLPDTLTVPLRADYANLRDEYLRYLNHEDDAELTAALASRADFEALLRSGKKYHRYELDAWSHAYPLLQKMTDELTKGDYEEFFALLWREVERGNLHAEDYASLYDRTYYRLHGKDWYGTLAAGVPSARPTTDKHIRTAKPKSLNDRRRAACLTVASAQDTLTPAQMREDFNYMMEQYERIHPNPTWSLGGERYNELKQQTLARLDHPMTQLDFWRIIARWNQHFDGHTQVGFPPTAPRMPEGMMAFPPKSIVQYRDNKLFFSAYEAMPDSLQGCEILAINGHPSAEIIDSIMPYISHESEAHINNVILRSLYWFYQAFYGYSSQMEFLYRTTDGENTVLLDRRVLYTWLVQVGDMGEIGGVGPRDIPWHFSIFPEKGIALFEFNSCGPNDKFPQFDSVVAACIDSVNRYGIRHLFVDISHNSGGNDAFCKRFLCHIDGLPDTVAAMDMTDTEMGTVAEPEEKRLTMSFTPKRPLYSGKLYFIQSQFTYSAAVLLANLAKQFRLGTVIGEETGGLTTTFTRHNPIMLPNSGLTFYCSDKQFRHIGTTGPRGVLPDIPLEIGYNYLFRSFTPEELQQMIK